MNCKVCGKENPSDVDLCVSCGSVLLRPVSENTKTSQAARRTAFPSYFREVCRNFARSPLMILFAICYSLGVVLILLQPVSATSLGGQTYSGLIDVLDKLTCILMAVGIWITCLDGWRKNDQPICLAGLTIITAIQMISMILVCIATVIVLVKILLSALIVLVLVGLVIYLKWIQVQGCMSVLNAARDCVPETLHIKTLSIIQFISAGLNFLILIIGESDNELKTIIDCVLAAFGGVLLLSYKSMMEDLELASVQMAAEEPAKAAEPVVEYIPAWKRVQMEKENSEK